MKTKVFPMKGTPQLMFDALLEVCKRYCADGNQVQLTSDKQDGSAQIPFDISINVLIDLNKIKWYMSGTAMCYVTFNYNEVIIKYTYPGAADSWEIGGGISKILYEKACKSL